MNVIIFSNANGYEKKIKHDIDYIVVFNDNFRFINFNGCYKIPNKPISTSNSL